MAKTVGEIAAQVKSEAITQVNIVATAALLWAAQQHDAPTEQVVALLPESVQPIARIVLPVIVGIVVQWCAEHTKKKTTEEVAAAVKEADALGIDLKVN